MTDTTVYDLEANFAAPDITPDMYDTYCDDQDWQNFLAGLNKDGGLTGFSVKYRVYKGYLVTVCI